MPSLTKDSRGRSPYWVCCYTTATGQRLKKSTKQTNRAKAMEVCSAIDHAEGLAREGNLTEQTAKRILGQILERTGQTLRDAKTNEWLAEWLTIKEPTTSPATLDKYKQVVKDFTESLGVRAKLPLSSITVADVAKYRKSITDAGHAPQTANNCVKGLSVAFSSAHRQGVIPLNPCTALGDPLPVSTAAREAFTRQQVAKLIAAVPAVDGDWGRAILFAFWTGARLRDVANMRWSNIDHAARSCTFTPEKTRRKSKEKTVTVPLSVELEKALLKAPGVGKAFIFPTLAGRQSGGCNGLSRQFSKIMERAGIAGKVIKHTKGGRKNTTLSFHSLRHSFNSELANAGVDQELRKKLTGHATTSANDDYTHHELETLRNAVSLVPSIAGGLK